MATKKNEVMDETTIINKKENCFRKLKEYFNKPQKNESSFGSSFNLSLQGLQNVETQLKSQPQVEWNLESQTLPRAKRKPKFKELRETGTLTQLKPKSKAELKLESALPRPKPISRLKEAPEAGTIRQLKSQPKNELKPESESKNQKLEPQAESKLESQALSTAKIISKFNVIPEAETMAQRKPKPDTELKLESQTLPRPKPISKLKELPEARTVPQLKSQPKTELKPESESRNQKLESKGESKLELQALPRAKIISKFNGIPNAETMPQLKLQPKAESKPESETIKQKPEPQAESELESQVLPVAEIISKFNEIPEARISPQLKPQPQAESKLESQTLPRAKIISRFNGTAVAGILPQLKAESKLELQTLPKVECKSKFNELPTGNLPRSEFGSPEPQKTKPTVVSEGGVNSPFRGKAKYHLEVGQLEPEPKVEPKCGTKIMISKEFIAEDDSIDMDQKTPKANYTCTCGRTVTLGDLLRNVETIELVKELNEEDLFSAFKKLANVLLCGKKSLEEEGGEASELEAPAHQPDGGQGQSPPQPPPPPPPPLAPPLPPSTDLFIIHSPLGRSGTLPLGLKPKKMWDVTNIKRAHWKTIDPRKLSDKSIWVKVQEEELASTELLRSLKTQFSTVYHKKSTIRTKATKESNSVKSVFGFPTISFMIILKSLKPLSSDAIKKSILACEHDAFPVETLDSLLRSLPLQALEEIRKVIVSQDDMSENYQDFLYKLAGINMLIPRLESMIFRIQYSETVQDIKPKIEKGIAACKNVVNSGKLKKILELILLCGNIMNSGSSSSPAYAFEMSFLSTLVTIKSAQSKTSLLHFLFNYIEEKFPDLLTFKYELTDVDVATRLSLKDVSSSIKAMEDKIEKLEIALGNHVPQNNDDKFSQVMGPFAKQARKETDELLALFRELEASYNDVADYLSMDKSQYTTENFFHDLKSFIDSFTNVHREKLRKREAEMELAEKYKTRDSPSPNRRFKRGRKGFRTEIYRIMDKEDRLEQEANGGLNRRNCRIVRNSFSLNH